MTRRLLYIVLIAATAALGAGCAGSGRDEYWDADASYSRYPADVAYFYDDLAPYGHWYQLEPYGWVWSPYHVGASWRPYSIGHWAYTDWGWTWISADPWGYAPYHYGRWTYDAFYGWAWVPDGVWGPGWVSWRYGGGWAGWAPLPPEYGWSSGYGLSYTGTAIDPNRWCFVREADLVTTRTRMQVLPSKKNRSLLGMTQDVTRYSVVDGRPAERGLSPAAIERSTGKSVSRYHLVPKEKGLKRETLRGQTLVMPRPTIPKDEQVESRQPTRSGQDVHESEKQARAMEKRRLALERRQEALERKQAALERRQAAERERSARERTLREEKERDRLERAERAQEERAREERARMERRRERGRDHGQGPPG